MRELRGDDVCDVCADARGDRVRAGDVRGACGDGVRDVCGVRGDGAGRIARQGGYFVCVSGLGWLIDFGLYTWLTVYLGVAVAWANFVSSLPAVTLVFLLSTREIFATQSTRLSLRTKYIVYLAYQCVLVSAVSLLAGWLYGALPTHFLGVRAELLAKCLVTPVTMACNFVCMKLLAEKL